MAVVIVTSPRRYFGLAADTKPTASAGASFYEHDTGLTYVSDGSAWSLERATE